MQETKAASVDILLFIVDYSPSLVREYMMQVSPRVHYILKIEICDAYNKTLFLVHNPSIFLNSIVLEICVRIYKKAPSSLIRPLQIAFSLPKKISNSKRFDQSTLYVYLNVFLIRKK